MSMSVLIGKGLDATKSEEPYGDGEEGEMGDDTDLAELGAKYMKRMGEALAAEDWAEAYKAFCRVNELHSYMEDQERGY